MSSETGEHDPVPNELSVLDPDSVFPHLCDDDIEINLSNFSECEKISVSKFQKNKTTKGLNIFHANLNSLESKHDKVHEFISSTSSPIDVIAITETSFQADNEFFTTNIKMEGYSDFSTPTNTSKGGCTLYIKDKYDVIPRLDLDIRDDHFESVWCEIKNNKGKNIVCASIYRHPHNLLSIYNSFLKYMENTLLTLTKENKELILCGDFNSDLLMISQNNNYNDFYELLASYGLFPYILRPTRVADNSATIVDNIFCNNLDNVKNSGVILTDFSDHYSQFLFIKDSKISYKEVNMFTRDYSNFSSDSFRDDVSIQTFDNTSNDVNVLFNDFYARLIGCVDRHAPIKKCNPKEIKMSQKPWITIEIKKLITKKNKLFKKKKKHPNNEFVKSAYNEARNEANRKLKKAKKEYYANYFQNNTKNSKKIWEGIKSIINTKNPKPPVVSQIKVDGRIIDSPKEIASNFNKFFTEIGPNTEKDIPKNPFHKPEMHLKNRVNQDFIIAHTSNEEILKAINDLENKSTGPHSIPTKLLKLIPDLILIPLSRIIAISFSSGVYPDALKISKVIPIHKGGSMDDLNNYRPISLLSIFDKLIEKLMHKQLYEFLEKNNVLFKNQYGNNTTL